MSNRYHQQSAKCGMNHVRTVKVQLHHTLGDLYRMTMQELRCVAENVGAKYDNNTSKDSLIARIMSKADVTPPDHYTKFENDEVPTLEETVTMKAANKAATKPQQRVLRGGIGNQPLVIVPSEPVALLSVPTPTVVSESAPPVNRKQSTTAAPKQPSKPKAEPLPTSYQEVMALGNDKVVALAKSLNVDISKCGRFTQRCAAVWAHLSSDKRVIPQEPKPVAVKPTESVKPESNGKHTPKQEPTVNVSDTVKAAAYKAAAGSIGACLVQLRSIGHTENNGESGAMILDLERIKANLESKGKATPVELLPSSIPASKPAVVVRQEPPLRPIIENVEPDNRPICRRCQRLPQKDLERGLCASCLYHAGPMVQDKEVRRIPDSPNVHKPTVIEQTDTQPETHTESADADTVEMVEAAIALGSLGALKKACKRVGLTVDGDSRKMKNALEQWLSNHTVDEDNDDEENDDTDDVITDSERKAMRDADEMLADEDDTDEPAEFVKGNRVEVVADESEDGDGSLIGKCGTVRSIKIKKEYTSVMVKLDGHVGQTEFLPEELTHTDTPKHSEETSIVGMKHDVKWSPRKVKVFEALQDLVRKGKAYSPTTAVKLATVAKVYGIKGKDMRHFCGHGVAGGLCCLVQSEEKGFYVYLTEKGRTIKPQVEWQKEQLRQRKAGK